ASEHARIKAAERRFYNRPGNGRHGDNRHGSHTMEQDPTPAAAREDSGRLDVRSAVFCMAVASRLCGHRLNTATLSHRYGRLSRMTRFDLVGALKEMGIAARAVPVNRNTIRKVPLPAIVTLKSGGYAVLTAIERKQGRLQELGAAT